MNATSTLVRAFAPWIDQLRSLIFHRAIYTAVLGPLMPILHNYLGRAVRRLDRLVLAWERDQLPTAPATRRTARPARKVAKTPRLPTAHNWLARLHAPAGHFRGSLEVLLADPDTRALAEATPQAGRILRPLCRMFGLSVPAWLQLPRRPRTPRAPKPPRPQSRAALVRSFRTMPDAELAAWFHPLPPHFNLPIPGFQKIRRRIRAFYARGGVRAKI